MKKIIIGMTCEKRDNKLIVSEDIILSLFSHEAIGVPLPYNAGESKRDIFLNACHGFVFCGGGDVDPSFYGEEPTGKEKNICFDRDVFEKQIFDVAFSENKPILAICRGMQAVNVFSGGSLYSHIDAHSQKEERHVATHIVSLCEHGRLRKTTGKETLAVNSLHHQAIKSLGSGLIIDAVSQEDGYIEAFHHRSHKFLLGIQWHPECLPCEASSKIFESFIDACK